MDTFASVRRGRSPLMAGSARRRSSYQHAISSIGAILKIAFVASCLLSSSAVVAEEVSKAQMQSLDEQVQEIKSDVLSIAAELSRLEETLLYPSGTQVALFVSLANDEKARLDAIQIQIDGELVVHYIYSHQELEALKKGGVQRIYTGNLPTGEHRVDVSVFGKLASGRDFSGADTFSIVKAVGPKIVGIELAANEFGNATIRIGGE